MTTTTPTKRLPVAERIAMQKAAGLIPAVPVYWPDGRILWFEPDVYTEAVERGVISGESCQ